MSQADDIARELLTEVVADLQAQVGALQRENAELKTEVAIWRSEHDPCPFAIELEEAKAENERLKAPVSDEEWKDWVSLAQSGSCRGAIDELVTRRATQPAPQELFNCTCESDVLGRCVVHETGVKRDMQSPMAGGESREKPAPQEGK